MVRIRGEGRRAVKVGSCVHMLQRYQGTETHPTKAFLTARANISFVGVIFRELEAPPM